MNEPRGMLDRLWLALVGFFRTAFVEGVTQGADELAKGLEDRTRGLTSGEGRPVVVLTVAGSGKSARQPSAESEAPRPALPPSTDTAFKSPHPLPDAAGLDARLKAIGPPTIPPMAPPPSKRGRGRPPKPPESPTKPKS